MKDIYQIDMDKEQCSKTIHDISTVDIVITMEFNVNCPYLPCKYREDWGLDYPSGKEDMDFLETMKIIESNIHYLANRIQKGLI